MAERICSTNTVILACTSLLLYVEAAQEKAGTDFEVVELDRSLHEYPAKMRARIMEAMETLPDRVENVLVSMGLCGGSWDNVEVSRCVVIPKVDDCITLLLHTDDTPHLDLKQAGHMYLSNCDDEDYSISGMKRRLCEKYGQKSADFIFDSWFQSYTHADVIDTGLYDCYSEGYVASARKNAELIRCKLDYVKGSNRILEKLVAGRWDEQFLVIEPGNMITTQSFLQSSKSNEGK